MTPPGALAVYAATSIGGANLWAAGWQARKFAAALMLIDPGLITDAVGAALLAAAVRLQRFRPAPAQEYTAPAKEGGRLDQSEVPGRS